MPSVVRTEPLYDQIYEILWDKILGSEIAPGSRLRDIEWAKRLNVSRTPVREALRKLQQDGILDPAEHGRFALKRIDADELRSLYRCRGVLEALAIRELGEAVAPEEIRLLAGLVERTEDCLRRQDLQRAFEFNTEFHERLTRLCGNSYLLVLLGNLKRLILYARASLKAVIQARDDLTGFYIDHLRRSQAHHQAIVEALARRDFRGAAARMEEHMFETAEDMRRILAQAEATQGA